MRRVAAAAETALPWLVATAAVVGLVVPEPGRAIAEANGVEIVLAVLVFATGLGIVPGAVAASRNAAGHLALAVAVGLVALPALAWAVSRGVPEGPLRQGVVALGIAPTEIAAVALTAMAGGNAAVTAAALVATAVATVALAGPLLSLLAQATVAPPVAVLATLVVVVAVPLAVGVGLRRTRVGERLAGLSDPLAVVTVTTLVWLVASQAELGAALVPAGVAVLVFLAGSVLIGEVVGRRAPTDTAHALRLSLSMRDFAVAAGAATAAFGPAAAAPAGLYGIIVLAYGSVYARVRVPAGRARPA
jgi:predicted Na+-dependent transporter